MVIVLGCQASAQISFEEGSVRPETNGEAIMSLDRFLDEKAESGNVDSQGSFTVDLSRAARKLSKFALPSEHHYLLRMVQLANLLRAEDIRIKIRRDATEIGFLSENGVELCDINKVCHTLLAPLETENQTLGTLASTLLGSLTEQNHETRWSFHSPKSRGEIRIQADRTVTSLVEAKEQEQVNFHSFRLSVHHKTNWKFWKDAGRRAAAASLVQQFCPFSSCRIFIDGRELPAQPVWHLNEHIHPLSLYRVGVTTSTKVNRAAASNILFQLADPEQDSFTLLRPSMNAYVVRRDHYNLWVSGTRASNSLTPDGESSASWMLQYRSGRENISMRKVRKRGKFRAALALHTSEETRSFNPRVIIVRHGVVVFDQQLLSSEAHIEAFSGCCFVLADGELETDLSGLRLGHSQALWETLKKYEHLVEEAKEFFQGGCDLLYLEGRTLG